MDKLKLVLDLFKRVSFLVHIRGDDHPGPGMLVDVDRFVGKKISTGTSEDQEKFDEVKAIEDDKQHPTQELSSRPVNDKAS